MDRGRVTVQNTNVKLSGIFPRLRTRLRCGATASLGCALAALLAACSKSGKTETAPAPDTATQSVTTVTATPSVEPDLSELNRELRRWMVRNQRPPKNFEDFAATANVQISPPPPGKKYVIDRQMHVILVKH